MPLKSEDVREIFLQAIELPSPAERAALLDTACAGDEAARHRIEALLLAHDRPESLLDRPAVASEGDAVCAPTLNQPRAEVSEKSGDTIGPYKLLEQIGEGGFGVVFMAEQTSPVTRKVALKVIKPGMDTREVIARFEAERQALALMDHPNIAKVLDAGATDTGRPFFVMELVRGVPITEYCDQAHLTPRQRLELFVCVCQAVQHAHQKGIIHRDIKPTNVLVAQHDDRPVVKVIDFGVAKATSGQLTDKTLFTGFAQLIGTPLYMSPEQAALSAVDIDTRSDIYSLGVLLYELLTGTTPFDKTRLQQAAFEEVRRIIREEEPQKPSTRLSSLGSTLPSVSAVRRTEPRKLSQLIKGDLDWIVMKALEKDRARRYETANGFAADVLHYLADEPVTACPPSAAYRFRKFARRNRSMLVMSSVVTLVVLTAVGSIGWMVRDRGVREEQAARERADRRSRISGQVALILDEVHRLEEEEEWPEALAAAHRAQTLTEGGDVEPDVAEQVRQVLRDLRMLQRLEEIRLNRATWLDGHFDNAGAAAAYAQAFRGYGVDLEELPTDDTVSRLSVRSQLVLSFAAAIDEFSLARRVVYGESDAIGNSLLSVVRALDPEPTRDSIRVLSYQAKTPELQAKLQSLAESIDVARQPAFTLTRLGDALRSAGLLDVSQSVLRQGQRQYPDDFWINFVLAFTLDENKDYEGAVRFYSVAIALRPSSLAAFNNLGLALNALERLEEAEICYRQAIELDAREVCAHINLGRLHHELGRLEEAEACYRRVIELDSANATAHNNLGLVLRDQGRPDEAEECYHRSLELNPKYARAHLNLGDLQQARGQLVEAVASYDHSIEIDPTNGNAYSHLARALYDLSKLEDAESACRSAIELDPAGWYAWSVLGAILRKQQRLDESIECYTKVIELKPDDAEDYSQLAFSLRAANRFDDAIEALEKAVELEPENAYDLNSLAWSLVTPEFQHKDPARAVELAQRAVELSPDDHNFRHTLGVAHYRAGNWEEAITALEISCRLDTTTNGQGNAWQWLFLAMAHWQLRHEQEARTWYDKAVELEKVWPDELRGWRDEAAALLGVTEPPSQEDVPDN